MTKRLAGPGVWPAGLLAASIGGCMALLLALILAANPPPSVSGPGAEREATARDYGELPLSFEPNAGRTDRRADFISRGPGYTLFLTGGGAVLSLTPAKGTGNVLRMELEGARSPVATGVDRLPGKVSSFVGDDPGKWRTGIPTYGRVRYAGVYPGIDIDWHGRRGRLEHDFRLAAGADPGRIQVSYAGADSLRVAANGDLLLGTAGRTIRETAPVAFQSIDGERRRVDAAFEVDRKTVSFRLGDYDAARPLVIDPQVLVYSTFLGGALGDELDAIDVDPATGEAYVAGTTFATDFPTTTGSFDETDPAAGQTAFVAKLNASGTGLDYSTYLGGTNGSDTGFDLDLNCCGGEIAITGQTSSSDFPTTTGAFDTTYAGGVDGYAAILDPAGSGSLDLLYSTYIGGAAGEIARGIAWDSSDIVVAGQTGSATFPTAGALSAYDATFNGGTDAFVTRLTPAGGGAADLDYSTFIGGGGLDRATAVDVDDAGDVYATGIAPFDPTQYPTVANSFDIIHGNVAAGEEDGFLSKLDLDAGAGGLIYSGYIGGAGNDDFAADVAVTASGEAYVVGRTNSANLQTTAGAYDGTLEGGYDAYLHVVNAAGDGRAYFSYFGGNAADFGLGIAIDSAGRAYLSGSTVSTDLPAGGGFDPDFNGGGNDGFVAGLSLAGGGAADLVSATYLGGTGVDLATAVDVDASGDAYAVGFTYSGDYPTSNGAFDAVYGGGVEPDGFVTRLTQVPPPAPAAVPAAAPSPSFGSGVIAEPAGGTVLVQVPGSGEFVPLEQLRIIPVGSIVDARNGFVRITAKQCDGVDETATFWDGIFQVRQSADLGCLLEAKLVEKLKCRGARAKRSARASAIAPVARSAAAASRRLWGKASGRFRTTGQRGSATVRGTQWLTLDRCSGGTRSTTFRLLEGRLAIDDFTSKGRIDTILKKGRFTAK